MKKQTDILKQMMKDQLYWLFINHVALQDIIPKVDQVHHIKNALDGIGKFEHRAFHDTKLVGEIKAELFEYYQEYLINIGVKAKSDLLDEWHSVLQVMSLKYVRREGMLN